jgi:hypothetical protein
MNVSPVPELFEAASSESSLSLLSSSLLLRSGNLLAYSSCSVNCGKFGV